MRYLVLVLALLLAGCQLALAEEPRIYEEVRIPVSISEELAKSREVSTTTDKCTTVCEGILSDSARVDCYQQCWWEKEGVIVADGLTGYREEILTVLQEIRDILKSIEEGPYWIK